jgi:acyl-CoA hydrolase
MKWIDQAGYACAVGWSGQYCVTVYVGGFRFYRPVLIGRTSMHVVIEVGARDPRDRLRTTTTTRCVIVFVAVDEQGNPVEVAK